MKRIIIGSTLVISSIVFIFSLYKTIYEYVDSYIEKKTVTSISKTNNFYINKRNTISKLQDNYNNKDIIGILKIDNLINEVIVKGSDNKYYLNHSIDKEKIKSGSIFMDYRNDFNSKQINIYGHNSTNNELPFKKLLSYLDESYYKDNKYITLYNDEIKNRYVIFSVSMIKENFEHEKLSFDNSSSWNTHFQILKNNSIYDTHENIDENDDILVLQTCMQGKNKGYLLVISARKEK